MKANVPYYMIMAATAVNPQPLTPVECDMLNKFLQTDYTKADR